jgi:mercuric reductase
MNRGCIPVKALVRSAEIAHLGRRFPEFGIKASPVVPDFDSIFARKEGIISHIYNGEKLLSDRGIDLIRGSACFTSAHDIEVDGQGLAADRFVVAAGSIPVVPPIPGLAEAGFWTSNEAISPDRQPESLAVIGGSAVGVELAQIYSRLGTRVTVIEALPRLVAGEEPAVSAALTEALAAEGIEVVTGVEVGSISVSAGMKHVHLGTASEAGDNSGGVGDSPPGQAITAEEILVATGRKSDLDGLGLEAAGVRFGGGGIEVDEHLRSSQPHIWASGDAIGNPMLAHFASHEGRIAGRNAMAEVAGTPLQTPNYLIFPHAIFTDPPIAGAGLGEEAARAEGYEPSTGVYRFDQVGRAATLGETRGFVKLVAEKGSRKLLGCHIIGPGADNLVHEAVVAIGAGLTIDDLMEFRAVHIHPTLSETVTWAADEVE